MCIESLIVRGYMADIFQKDGSLKRHQRKNDNSGITFYLTALGVMTLVVSVLINVN